jgi:hypothetical protein
MHILTMIDHRQDLERDASQILAISQRAQQQFCRIKLHFYKIFDNHFYERTFYLYRAAFVAIKLSLKIN